MYWYQWDYDKAMEELEDSLRSLLFTDKEIDSIFSRAEDEADEYLGTNGGNWGDITGSVIMNVYRCATEAVKEKYPEAKVSTEINGADSSFEVSLE